MFITLEDFDRKAWIRRLGATLEETVANVRHTQVPFWFPRAGRIETLNKEALRHYREMAALANTDPYAAKLFDESHLWLDALPEGVLDVLLEHPVLSQAYSGKSRHQFRFLQSLGHSPSDAKFLVTHLAKLSARVGGEYAATLLHRFLAAGNHTRLHAHEVTVFHGLEFDNPIPLGRGTYLASFDDARERFGLPWDPEPWLSRRQKGLNLNPGRIARTSLPAVLVRPFRWGLAVPPPDESINSEFLTHLNCRFPNDHRIDSIIDLFEEREALLHLLSIAVQSKLVSHTTIVAIPPWMKQLDPNIRTQPAGGSVGVFDVWPKDRTPSAPDIQAFVTAAHGWLTFCAGKRDRSTELAIRRTAASFGISSGRFGTEDRILDAAVALEALYGPCNKDITRKISRRAASLLSESGGLCNTTLRQMKSFYRTRSKIVHGTVSKNKRKRERELTGALASGRELARRTLFALLDRGPINSESEWDALVPDDHQDAT